MIIIKRGDTVEVEGREFIVNRVMIDLGDRGVTMTLTGIDPIMYQQSIDLERNRQAAINEGLGFVRQASKELDSE